MSNSDTLTDTPTETEQTRHAISAAASTLTRFKDYIILAHEVDLDLPRSIYEKVFRSPPNAYANGFMPRLHAENEKPIGELTKAKALKAVSRRARQVANLKQEPPLGAQDESGEGLLNAAESKLRALGNDGKANELARLRRILEAHLPELEYGGLCVVDKDSAGNFVVAYIDPALSFLNALHSAGPDSTDTIPEDGEGDAGASPDVSPPLAEFVIEILHILASKNRPMYKMTLEECADKLGCANSTFIEKIKPYRASGEILSSSSVGYYLPNDPPKSPIVETKAKVGPKSV